MESALKKSQLLHAVAWSFIGLSALAWSALAWPTHALAEWVAANTGALAGLPGWIERWTPPAWLAAWLPDAALGVLKATLASATPLLEWLLALLPGLAGWLPALVLAAWASGLLLLLVAGIACSIAIGLLARAAPARSPEAP